MAIPVISPPTPAKAALKIIQGADFTFTGRNVDPVTKEPVDVSGWTGRAQIRTTVGGVVMVDIVPVFTSDGFIRFTILSTVTEDVKWNTFSSGVWDMEVVTDTGRVMRIVEGPVTLSPDVTRSV